MLILTRMLILIRYPITYREVPSVLLLLTWDHPYVDLRPTCWGRSWSQIPAPAK